MEGKSSTGVTLDALYAGMTYYVVVETRTRVHANNPNIVVSERTPETSATTLSWPQLSINDVTVTEGNSGPTAATFTVTFSPAWYSTVWVSYETVNGTAVAGSDYVAASGLLTFPAGVTTRPVTVTVNGDTVDEPIETFQLRLVNPINASLGRAQGIGTIIDDDGTSGGDASPIELTHGASLVRSLAAWPGPTQSEHSLLVEQKPYSSYELVVDEISGDLQTLPLFPLSVQLLSADGTTVARASQGTTPLGQSRSLRFANMTASVISGERIRVRSGGCATSCGVEDTYRLRFYETTCTVPRFNNSGTQLTVLILQNIGSQAVTGEIHFWRPTGALVGVSPLTIAAGSVSVLNTSTVQNVSGHSGSITIAHDGPYGVLVGKTVSLEPATGFSFDSPLSARLPK